MATPQRGVREWRIEIPEEPLEPAFAERLDALLFAQRRSLLSSSGFHIAEPPAAEGRFLCSIEPSVVTLFEVLQQAVEQAGSASPSPREALPAATRSSCLLSVLNILLVMHEIGQPHLELSTSSVVSDENPSHRSCPDWFTGSGSQFSAAICAEAFQSIP